MNKDIVIKQKVRLSRKYFKHSLFLFCHIEHSSTPNHRSHSTSANRQKSRSPHRTSSQSNLSSVQPTVISSEINTSHTGVQSKISNIIFSVLNLISENFLTLFKYIQRYPIKTTILIILFITILCFHSFYLIKLANRIENRLQTLHHKLPSSSIRDSISTNSQEL